MSADPLSIAAPSVGVFMDDSVANFTPAGQQQGISFIHSATNLQIHERRFGTRPRWRELTLESAPEDWALLNTQGMTTYDPTIGETPFNSPSGEPGLIESAGGKLFRITPGPSSFIVEDISNGVRGSATVRLAWMCQAENYIIKTDEASPTQIWDGKFTFTSSGYNYNTPETSRLPNFAGPVLYSDRIWIVINGNEVIAGDHLHRLEPVDNVDLLKTTDQSYDITSVSFTSPNELGNITSLNLVTSARGGDLAAQGEVVAGTQGPGMWGIIAGTPRIQWSSTSMRRQIHPLIAPVGPFASYTTNDELVCRTLEGFTSLKYASAETSQVGNPHVNLGNEIKPLLDKDPADLLIYASMLVSARRQRLACTVWPVVDGPHRWHRGCVTAALSPGRTRTPEPMVWEGISTLPEAMGEIIQFIKVRAGGNSRILAMLRKSDGTKTLAEGTDDWADDLLADGTTVPVPWQLLTRKLSPGGEYSTGGYGDCFLSLLNIRKKLDVQVFARDRDEDDFKQVYDGHFENKDWECKGTYANCTVNMGAVLGEFKRPWVQILIKGTGHCIVDMAVSSPTSGKKSGKTDPAVQCLSGEKLCTFNPFLRG